MENPECHQAPWLLFCCSFTSSAAHAGKCALKNHKPSWCVCPTVSWRMDEGCEMLLCNSWKAFYREMQHQCWTPAPQNHQHHTWTRDQASLLLSTPFLREMNSRNSSFSSPSITSFQKKKLLHLCQSPSGCRICSTAPGSRAEHHLALLHPSHPAGSGCIHLPMAQRGALVRFSSEERMETGFKRNRLFHVFPLNTWVSGRAG